jgi:hypothetical protein
MAINILSILPLCAESEQLISGARHTRSRIGRLSPANLQGLECMGNWLTWKLISLEELLAMIVKAVEMNDEMDNDFDEED